MKKRKNSINPAFMEKIRAAKQMFIYQGKNRKEIAKILKSDPKTIGKWVKEFKWDEKINKELERDPAQKKDNTEPKQKDKMLHAQYLLMYEGYTIVETAKAVPVDVTTLRKWIKDNDWKRRFIAKRNKDFPFDLEGFLSFLQKSNHKVFAILRPEYCKFLEIQSFSFDRDSK